MRARIGRQPDRAVRRGRALPAGRLRLGQRAARRRHDLVRRADARAVSPQVATAPATTISRIPAASIKLRRMYTAALLVSLLAQAEAPPAPAPPPAVARPASPVPANSISVHVRFAYRVGNEGRSVGPAAGFSLGGMFERRYLASRRGIELGRGGRFLLRSILDRGGRLHGGRHGQETVFAADRTLSETSFALLQTAGWRYAGYARVRSRRRGRHDRLLRQPGLCLRPATDRSAADRARRLRASSFAHRTADGRHPARRLHATPSPGQTFVADRRATGIPDVRRSLRRRRRLARPFLRWPAGPLASRSMIVPAVGLAALGLAIVATAGARPGATRSRRASHFAVRQASAPRSAARSAVWSSASASSAFCVAAPRAVRRSRSARRPPCSFRASACAPRAPAAGCTSARSRAARRRS